MPVMTTHTYIYNGKHAVFVPSLGTVQPGQNVESASPLTHPDFETYKEAEVTKTKKN